VAEPGRVPIGAGVALPYETARGFNVLMWREGELGYALVSDLDAGELGELATKLGRRS